VKRKADRSERRNLGLSERLVQSLSERSGSRCRPIAASTVYHDEDANSEKPSLIQNLRCGQERVDMCWNSCASVPYVYSLSSGMRRR